jgi:hypothetical protein
MHMFVTGPLDSRYLLALLTRLPLGRSQCKVTEESIAADVQAQGRKADHGDDVDEGDVDGVIEAMLGSSVGKPSVTDAQVKAPFRCCVHNRTPAL